MLFLIGFAWHVAASFAFVLAILTPNWLWFSQTQANVIGQTVQRGVFFVCDLLTASASYKTETQCTSILMQSSSPEPTKWIYAYAIASASLAIACASLSIILFWLCGLYFHARQRANSCTTCLHVLIILLLLLIFCLSFIVWILLISETLVLGYPVNTSTLNWPMWLAVGATGGYLMSFLTMLFAFCAIQLRRSKSNKHLYHDRNQF